MFRMFLNLLLKEMILFLISKHKKDLLFILEVLATSVSVDTSDVTESGAKRQTTMFDSQVLILPVVLVASAIVDISNVVESATKRNRVFLISKKKKDLLFILEVLVTGISLDISDVTESVPERQTTMLDT